MRQDIKDRWLAALESGDYPKTIGNLKDKYGYCCLGVLCDLAAAEGIGTWEKVNSFDFAFKSASGTDTALLPKAVADWAEISVVGHESESYLIYAGNVDLAGLNDRHDTFGLIVSTIRANDKVVASQ